MEIAGRGPGVFSIILRWTGGRKVFSDGMSKFLLTISIFDDIVQIRNNDIR